jgi:hypothetical protein
MAFIEKKRAERLEKALLQTTLNHGAIHRPEVLYFEIRRLAAICIMAAKLQLGLKHM